MKVQQNNNQQTSFTALHRMDFGEFPDKKVIEKTVKTLSRELRDVPDLFVGKTDSTLTIASGKRKLSSAIDKEIERIVGAVYDSIRFNDRHIDYTMYEPGIQKYGAIKTNKAGNIEVKAHSWMSFHPDRIEEYNPKTKELISSHSVES